MQKTITYGWSRCSHSTACIIKIKNIEELKKIVKSSVTKGKSICPMGTKNSFGDEFQNKDNIIIDLSGFNKIISWNVDTGIMVVESGVTFQQALKVCLADGWILPVVPGTRFPTIGGAAANNIHGKNSFKEGNFGDWVLEFKIFLGSNEILTCSLKQNSDLFYSAIGGMGMLGIFTQITLQLRKIATVNLQVRKWTVPNLKTMVENITTSALRYDFVIGQFDCFKKGKKTGRGTIHVASYSNKNTRENYYVDDLEISEKVFSILPSYLVIKIGKIFMSSFTMGSISSLKYYKDFFSSKNDEYIETFPKFNFLLDKIPKWPKIFKNGFYEIEPLIPIENAYETIKKILELSHKSCFPSYLSAIKIHNEDNFILSYSMKGISISLDFPIIPKKKDKQKLFFNKIHDIILRNNGIIYLAKDNLITCDVFKKMYGEKVNQFMSIKHKYDPGMLFQSNLFRRVFLDNKPD